MRFLVLPVLFLAACPDNTPDDSCFEEGPATVAVTLEADVEVDTSELSIKLLDCMEGEATGTGAVGDTVSIEAPSSGELTVEVTGTWSGGLEDTAGESGTCTGTATVDPEADTAEVTVQLTCTVD